MSWPNQEIPAFALTANHLTLMRRMFVDWDGTEFGAPCIDPKRPYGNSDVIGDIGELLGWTAVPDPDDEEPWSAEQIERAKHLHRSMQTALQIVLCTQSFVPGTYVKRDRYKATSWELAP